jgi:hypothetical protein
VAGDRTGVTVIVDCCCDEQPAVIADTITKITIRIPTCRTIAVNTYPKIKTLASQEIFIARSGYLHRR